VAADRLARRDEQEPGVLDPLERALGDSRLGRLRSSSAALIASTIAFIFSNPGAAS